MSNTVLSSQLEQWWLDAAYLEGRSPSQLTVNFAGPAPYLEHRWPPAEGTALERASVCTWHMLQYWNLIRTWGPFWNHSSLVGSSIFLPAFHASASLPCFRERLAPQKAGETPLDMDQFRMLYCTCKVPGVTKDAIRSYFKTGARKSTFDTRTCW